MKKKAFTLIELLVVIAIIALLLSILMPSLQIAKRKAATVLCLTNTKNLSLGWYMYQSENNGRLIGGRTSKASSWVKSPRNSIGTPLPSSQIAATSPEVTDDDEIRGIVAGHLYDYLDDSGVYHCPADNARRAPDGSRVFVSYSIARCLNGDFPKERKRFSDISSPSIRYNFVETAEQRNWNMGASFPMGAPELSDVTEWSWWGPLAINHGDSSVLGFCDGHSEVRKWRDQYTIDRVHKLTNAGVTSYGKDIPPAGQTEDIRYMAQGWATQ